MNTSLLKKELQHCYSSQAEHFKHTRKKQRPELKHIEEYLQENTDTSKQIVVLELWCWAWRLSETLTNIYQEQLIYIWTDVAPWMIEESIHTHKGDRIQNIKDIKQWLQRMVWDMLDILANTPDSSVDVVISIASLQHLMTKKERQIAWLHMYRILNYNWTILSTNRSYSSRFLKKYRKQQTYSLLQMFVPPRKWVWNDIIIPRKDPQWKENKQIRRRYYHIFTLYELEQLTRLSWFVIKVLSYVMQDGSLAISWRKNSRNTLLIAKKTICR